MRKSASLFMMLMLLCTLAYSQARTVTGQVKDENGKPVPFATVTEEGTKNATQADENGNFSISVPPSSRLTISSSGFQPQTVVAAGNTIELTLSKGGQLQEVVVTALGIRRSERGLGYAVSKIDPNVITQKSEPDALKGLQGKVAGVDIRSSQGTPGAATRIQIRGNSSFFGATQPLIIVDGIPYSNEQVSTSNQTEGGGAYASGFSNLDPNDIATMSVLKGSSAAALYGSRASNGVIVITTKSGSAGRNKKGSEVTVKSSVSMEEIANLPEYQNEFGAGANSLYSNSNGSWGPAFKSQDSIPAWPTYKAAYPELFPSANIAYRAYPNNVKDLFERGMVFENSIGFNGGDGKNSVGLTASQLTHNGYVPFSNYRRGNLGIGASTKLNMGLNLSGNFSYARSTQRGGIFGENQVSGASSQFARSLFLARNWDVSLPFQDRKGNPVNWNGVSQYDHPTWAARYNTAKTDDERFVASAHADVTVFKWVRFDYTLGTNVNALNRNEVTEVGSRAAEGVGRLVQDHYRIQEIESNFLVTLTPEISKDFGIKAILGNNVNQRTSTRQTNTGKSFITRGTYTLKNTAQQEFTSDLYARRRILGVFGDVTLNLKQYAFLNATLRNDWSTTLPVENRSYLYPSVSGSFVFSDALGIKGSLFDFGKIRAGWAKVGRDADPYSLQDYYVLGPNFLGQPTVSTPTVSNNPDLKPEFTREVELGTQLSFFKRKAELDFTWYNRRSENLIATISVPPSSGYQYKVLNFGGIRNRGIEVDLTIRPVKTQNFGWEIHGIFTKNENIVTDLTTGVDRIQLNGVLEDISPYLEPGKPFGYLRGTLSARDSLGNLLIDPETGWMIPATEPDLIGDPNPDFKLGVTNTLTFKGLSLSVLWDMTKGGDLYSVTVSSLMGRGVTLDTRDRTAMWIIPGVYGDVNTVQPILVGGKEVPNKTVITTNDLYFGSGSFAINAPNEWNVYDATVYRLREVTLAYDFPKSLFKKLPIGSASLSLTGRNLWFRAPNFPKYTNFDPEVNSFGATSVQGIELSAAPTTRRYGVNLSFTF